MGEQDVFDDALYERSVLLRNTPSLRGIRHVVGGITLAFETAAMRAYLEEGTITWTSTFIDAARFFLIEPAIEKAVSLRLRMHDNAVERKVANALGVAPADMAEWEAMPALTRARRGIVWGAYPYNTVSQFVLHGCVDVVREMLRAGRGMSNQTSNYLALACGRGRYDMVAMLLQQGYGTSEKCGYGLGSALEAGDLREANLLAQHGADVHVHDELPLDGACKSGKVSVVKWVLDRGATVKDKHLFTACAHSSRDIVEYLLRHSPTLHVTEAILHTQCPWIVDYLVSHGADVNVGDGVALRLAWQEGREDTVDALLKHGVVVTPNLFGAACRYAGQSIVRRLLEHCDAEAIDSSTGLTIACTSGRVEVAKLILEHGVDMSTGGSRALRDTLRYGGAQPGVTLRYGGAQPGVVSCVQVLIAHGAWDDECVHQTLQHGPVAMRVALLDALTPKKQTHGHVFVGHVTLEPVSASS